MKAMKKIVSLALTVAMLAMSATAVLADKLVLSPTTKVNVDNTSETIFAKATSDEYHTDSSYYMHYKTAGDWLEAAQTLAATATAGSQYVLSAVVKHVVGQLWVRVGWDGDVSNAWMAIDANSEGTDLGNGWKKYEKTITMQGNQSTLIMHNAGATECYIDSVSLVAVDSGNELMADSEFEKVSYNAETDTITSTSMNLPEGVTMVREAKTPENEYSLHMYTEGDWLEIGQDFTSALTAGKYTLTVYAKGTGAVWYYQNWGTEWAKFDIAYGEMQPDGWAKFVKEIDVDGDGDTSFLIHSEGALDLYIDDISLVDANGVDYIKDGGFGEVTVIEDVVVPPALPNAEFTLSPTTTVNVPNTDTIFAKIAGDTNENYLHFKTGGDWLEVSQKLTETAVAGGQYVITVVAKPVQGKVWFRIGWDDAGWLASSQMDLATDLGDGWYKYVKTVTLLADQNTFLFHNDGATEFYIDSISLMPVGEEKELIPDGDFGEVNAFAEVEMGEVDCKAWDVIINDFSSTKTYKAIFTDGDAVKDGEIGFENVEADGGSVAFAILLHTSRANATLKVVTE